jgi:hypothetical protein
MPDPAQVENFADSFVNVPAEVRIPFLNKFTKNCRIRMGPRNPECGNGRYHYLIQSFDDDGVVTHELAIHFQEGALTENPRHNGIFGVALACVLIDHLKSYQDGEFATRESAIAITKLEEAVHWLSARSDDRASRGVLGQHKK